MLCAIQLLLNLPIRSDCRRILYVVKFSTVLNNWVILILVEKVGEIPRISVEKRLTEKKPLVYNPSLLVPR